MILSMTGFGEARAEEAGVSYRVEIRSLNNRYFKAAIKVPELFQRFETKIDKQLRSRMGRGSVAYSLRVKDENPAAAYEINTAVLGEYVSRLKEVAGEDAAVRIDLARLAEVPGILQPPELSEDVLAERLALVRRLTEEAIDQLVAMRETEGQALLRDLQHWCGEIRSRAAAIGERAPFVVEEYRRKLKNRVQQLLDGGDGSNIALYQDAVAREVAIYAERCDINEELSRIESHLDQFAALCHAPEEAGRKLDFLTQELLREANTIGSKSGDPEISRQVVEMKAAIDRIKEQVQNVE
ncbi:MAG: YicC/YloC family endoribonuclease [Phycisphaerae bacterium]